MNPPGVCSVISPPCAPAFTINSSFSKQRLPSSLGPPHPTCLGVQGDKENRRKEKKNQLFSGSLQRLHCPFLPLFLSTSPSRLVPLEQSSVTAKPCPVPVQRHLHLDCRAHHVLPQLFPVSLQLFTQPLTQALVNPANAHGEQPERCHLGRGDSLKTRGSSDLQPGFLTAATRQPQGDAAYGGRKFVGPELFPPTPPLS